MLNKTENKQFQPTLPVQSQYCRLELPSDFPVVCMKGDLWYTSSYEITMVHFHNCLQIGYCYEGEGHSLIGDYLWKYSKGDISIIPLKIQHHCLGQPNKISRWKWLYLDPLALLPSLNPNFVKKIIPVLYDDKQSLACVLNKKNNPEIVSIVFSIIYAMEHKEEGYKDIVRSLTEALLVLILRVANQSDKNISSTDLLTNANNITPAIQHIASSYMLPITVPQLAEICHMSPTHLRRNFSAVMNCSPLEYLQLVRMEAACALLLHTDASVTEVGIRSGFPTESSFIRQFKKHFDNTPGKWRKTMSSKADFNKESCLD